MSTRAKQLEKLLIELRTKAKATEIEAFADDPLDDGHNKTNPHGWYSIQVRNHIRRIKFNTDEALDYLKFITGEKKVG